MRLPFISFRRHRLVPGQGLEEVRSLFAKFQRIQKHNTRVLELMAEMDRALGGEYIFDRAFLESSVRELSGHVYQVVYCLNAMSRNEYVALFDRYQSIKGVLDDILAGGVGPFGASLALPYSVLGVEMEPLAGALNVCLAEARNRLDIAAPDGFAVTVIGCSRLIEAIGAAGAAGAAGPHASRAAGRAVEVPEIDFPPELAEAINYQVEALFDRHGGPVPLTVRICSSAMNSEVLTNVESKDILDSCRQVLAGYLAADEEPGDAPVALAVNETVSGYLAGWVSGVATPGSPSGGLFCITAWPADAPDRKESFFLRRTYPFDLVESEIKAKPFDQQLYAGVHPLTCTPKGLYRGSALMGPSFLRSIAECAAAFERILGYPQNLGWVRGDGERPVIVNVSPASGLGGSAGMACDSVDLPEGAEVMLTGGETVQMGIAAGPVVHVSESELDRFPYGAVAVARQASPRLSAIMRRASAIVTEIGASIGHLATIARELRIPAIFGADGAMERLPEGTEVTVDAGDRTVYRGIVEPLLASRACSTELYPNDPEYVALRRLLRWIMPLDLIDPDSSAFSVDNCRTYHEIIHFAHERSIEELLKIQEHGAGLKSQYVRNLEIDTPIDLFVLDIGGGVSPEAGPRVRMDDVISKPFLAFLRGLSLKELWDRDAGSLSIREIISGFDRTFAAIMEPPEFSGRNHAILAENYMNVGLRLGYHYSVIDSYLSGNINQNYVYFRFAGGFADENHRRRRAEFIRTILDQLSFKVTVKGDLVLGKLKLAGNTEVISALKVLGELTGFTRQIDLSMDSENRVEQFARLFREKSRHAAAFGQQEKTRA
ncbi:MAG: PEP-utilizing enzyme [Syntrophobacteraceae bacterium]